METIIDDAISRATFFLNIEPEPPPPVKPIILLDAADATVLSLKLLRYNHPDGATYDDLTKVRNFPQRKWSEHEGAWLIPLTEPNLDHLTASWPNAGSIELLPGGQLLLDYYRKTREVADIHLRERLTYLEKKGVEWPTDYAFNTKPYDHQVVAFNSCKNAEFFAHLMEMGTGKTKVVVDAICWRAQQRKKGTQLRVLIVAPKTICSNWIEEFEKHTTMDINLGRLDRRSAYKRMEQLLELIRDKETPVIIAVINYEGVKMLEEALAKVQFDLMVCDESTWIKNSDAERTKACVRVGRSCASRMILTGLPITKNVLDLYSQFDFLKEGSLGFTSYYAYQSYFSEANWWGGYKSWKKDKLPELQERLARHSFIIRRHQCLDLPEKIYETREIEMTPEQTSAYEQMAKDLVVDLEELKKGASKEESAEELNEELRDLLMESSYKEDGSNRFSEARIILVKLLRLAQITSGFLKLMDGTVKRFDPNAKVQAIRELLEDLDDNDKVVIWSRFREDIEHIVNEFKDDFGAVPFYGGVTSERREEYIKRWKESPNCRLFVAQPQTGGFGINLVEASRVIYFSNDFSLQNRVQSEDRCHRIGQKKNVVYTDLVVPLSIDALVLDAIKQKRDMATMLVDRDLIVKALKMQLKQRQEEQS